MAGEWVKIRVWLSRDPKTIAVADYLASDRRFMNWLSDPVQRSCRESAHEHVSSDVIVMITVSSLVIIWGITHERGKEDKNDLVLDRADVTTLDRMCGVPGIGEAMSYVGWVVEENKDEPSFRLRFPNFLSESAPYDKSKRAHADAQKRYIAKKRANQPDDHTDISSDVTMTPREEKRREEKKEENTPPPPKGARTRNDASKLPEIPPELNTPEFAEAWADWVQHRSERKPKMTPTAAKQAFAKLAAWGPVRSVAAIKHSIAGSYQGIFENTSSQKPGQSQGAAQPVTDLQAIAAKQREREREAALHAERAERDRLARGGNIFAKPRPEPEPPHSPPADEEESSACPF